RSRSRSATRWRSSIPARTASCCCPPTRPATPASPRCRSSAACARPPTGAVPQGPALEIVTRAPEGRRAYPLSEPLDGLALDPRGERAVLFATSDATGLVSNPNELLLIDLTQPAASAAP